MATKTKIWTYQDYYKLDTEKRYEVLEGELIEMSAPKIIHQKISIRLASKLLIYCDEKRLGEVYASPCDVVLSPINTLQPDILFISNENLAIIQEQNISGTPDLVIEILSPSNQDHDKVKKFKIYEKFGVKELWIIDPDDKTIKVYVLDAGTLSLFSDLKENENVRSKIFTELNLSLSDLL